MLRPRVVESELSDGQRTALAESCADLGLEVDGWPDVPTLRTWAQLVAGARRVRRLMAIDPELSRTRAIGRAAAGLGLTDKALEAALRRASAKPADCSSPTESAA